MKRYIAALILCVVGLSAQATYASIINLSPVDDGQIVTLQGGYWAQQSNTDRSTINVSRSGGVISVGILEFDFAQIPDLATLTGATLHLTTASIITNVGDNPATLYVYGFTGDGDVANGDQNTAATLLASAIYPTGAVNSPPRNTPLSLSFDNIGPLISAASGDDFFTLRLYVPSYVTLPIYSSEATVENYRPYLSIGYNVQQGGSVPEPNSMALAALGLLLLAASRVRLY